MSGNNGRPVSALQIGRACRRGPQVRLGELRFQTLMHYVDPRQRRLRHGGGPGAPRPRRRRPHHAGLRRARPLLLPPGPHVRLRGPDEPPRHRALRPRPLRADGLRAAESAWRRSTPPATPWSSPTARVSATTSCSWPWARRRGRPRGREPRAPASTTSSPSATSEALDREARRGCARPGRRRRPHRRGGGRGPPRPRPPRDASSSARTGTSPPPSTERESAVVAEHMRGTASTCAWASGVDEIHAGRRRRRPAVRLETGGDVAADLVVVVDRRRCPTPPSSPVGPGPLSNGKAPSRWTTPCGPNAPDVWAAGDCANVTWVDGSRRPEQLWYTARDQGRVAARADARGRRLVSARHLVQLGQVLRHRVDDRRLGAADASTGTTRRSIRAPTCAPGSSARRARSSPRRSSLEGDRVVGFNMLGSRWNHEPLLQWIHERRGLDWVLKRLHEAQFDEEFMPAVPRPSRRDGRVEAAGRSRMQAGLMNTYQRADLEPADRWPGFSRPCWSWPTSSSTSAADPAARLRVDSSRRPAEAWRARSRSPRRSEQVVALRLRSTPSR